MATIAARVLTPDGEIQTEISSFKQIQQIVEGMVELGWLRYLGERYLVAVNEDGLYKLPLNPAEFFDSYGNRIPIHGNVVLMPVDFDVDTLG
jgi:hypothetical protein